MAAGGEFLTLHSEEVSKANNVIENVETFRAKRIDQLVSFSGITNTCCIYECKENHELILFATCSNKIIGIDSLTHEVHTFLLFSATKSITTTQIKEQVMWFVPLRRESCTFESTGKNLRNTMIVAVKLWT